MSATRRDSPPAARDDAPMAILPPKEIVGGVSATETLIRYALETSAGIETVERLLALLESERQREAKRLLLDSFRRAQHEFAPIEKNREGQNGNYRYATLDAVLEAIEPALHQHGMTLTFEREFKLSEDGSRVVMVGSSAVVSHQAGASMKFPPVFIPVASPATKDGRKILTPAQEIGMAITYADRYACQALGIRPVDEDVDGCPAETAHAQPVASSAAKTPPRPQPPPPQQPPQPSAPRPANMPSDSSEYREQPEWVDAPLSEDNQRVALIERPKVNEKAATGDNPRWGILIPRREVGRDATGQRIWADEEWATIWNKSVAACVLRVRDMYSSGERNIPTLHLKLERSKPAADGRTFLRAVDAWADFSTDDEPPQEADESQHAESDIPF